MNFLGSGLQFTQKFLSLTFLFCAILSFADAATADSYLKATIVDAPFCTIHSFDETNHPNHTLIPNGACAIWGYDTFNFKGTNIYDFTSASNTFGTCPSTRPYCFKGDGGKIYKLGGDRDIDQLATMNFVRFRAENCKENCETVDHKGIKPPAKDAYPYKHCQLLRLIPVESAEEVTFLSERLPTGFNILNEDGPCDRKYLVFMLIQGSR